MRPKAARPPPNSISASSLTAVWTTTGMPPKATERRRSSGCWRLPSRAYRALRAGSPSSMPMARMRPRPLRRFTDGFGIGRVVLLPLDERLDVGRRDQSHTMAQLADLARPVVRAGTGLHRDDAWRLRRQEADKLRAGDALAEQHMPGSIGSVHLKHVLRDVQPDRDSLPHGRLLL